MNTTSAVHAGVMRVQCISFNFRVGIYWHGCLHAASEGSSMAIYYDPAYQVINVTSISAVWRLAGHRLDCYRLQITDYRLAPSKWGAREEPTSAPWATIEDTLSS
jgi:hypothetical protein